MTVKLFIAATLDGYIATLDDSLQWLFDVEGEGDNGYGAFYETIDTLVMGKKTYDWLLREQPNDWAYTGKKCFVLTHQQLPDTDSVKFTDEKILSELTESTEQIWVIGGGEIIKLFLENHLVDELQVTIAPVLLGTGKPLFPSGNYTEQLQLVSSKTYGQFVELHYLVKNNH
ncbi:dihydrofolate reductase family protein [Lactococcus protaetiae]|uniref:Dihydrofolate reductase n=1 Tax=Lactococcus protaetiae TaxID=2592653 RepID=A0A514Z5N8_9LACT|nr:dihydrofolate reductase family protein [Lactococcus protaetiae]QDK69898.1 dihydrofolate reductase [Lactococcus protaetiae]